MDGQSSTHARTDDFDPAALAADLATVFVGVLLALECVIAGVLLVRRAQGALSVTASPGWLMTWMALAVAVTAAARLALGKYGKGDAGMVLAVRYLPTGALALTALALTSFRAPFVVLMLWAMVVVEEAAARLLLREGLPGTLGRLGLRERRRWLGGRVSSESGPESPAIDERPGPADSEPAAGRTLAHVDRVTSARFAQRIERVQSVDGTDLLSGTLTARLAPGQITAHVHVAFCPPFSRVPRLDFRQMAGPAARIKVGQVLPHGVRFDLKLNTPAAEPVTLSLEVRALHAVEQSTPSPHGNSALNE